MLTKADADVWIQLVVARSDDAFASLDLRTRRNRLHACQSIIRLVRETFLYDSHAVGGASILEEGERAEWAMNGVKLLYCRNVVEKEFNLILFTYYRYPASSRLDGIQTTHEFADALLLVVNDDDGVDDDDESFVASNGGRPIQTFRESRFNAETLQRWPELRRAIEPRRGIVDATCDVMGTLSFGYHFHRYLSFKVLRDAFVGDGSWTTDDASLLRNSPLRIVYALTRAVFHQKRRQLTAAKTK